MRKFPVDAPKERGVKALEILGFQIVREKELGQSWVNTLKSKLWASSDKIPKPEQNSDIMSPQKSRSLSRRNVYPKLGDTWH